MSKIKTKIYDLGDEYKLTVYSGDESFDLYFDTEEDADEIADLAQSYDSFEEAQSELDADGNGELDGEDDELDDEDSVITEKAAGPKDIKSVVDALNNSGLLGHDLVYNGVFNKYSSDLGVSINGLGNKAVDAGAFTLKFFFKDDKNGKNREKIVNDIINPLGYHEVNVGYPNYYVVVPKSISKEKLIKLIEQGCKEDFINDRMSGKSPYYTPIFQNDKIIVFADRCIDGRFYKVGIVDITPENFDEGSKYIKIRSILHDTGEDIKDAVKFSTNVKGALTKIKKYLKDNGIQYKIII